MIDRQAVPGLTPVRDVLSHEERISKLERENADLRQMLIEQATCIRILNNTDQNLRQCLRIAASVDLSHNARLTRVEGRQHGDMRLSEVLSGIESRLAKVELGAELLP